MTVVDAVTRRAQRRFAVPEQVIGDTDARAQKRDSSLGNFAVSGQPPDWALALFEGIKNFVLPTQAER